MVSISQVESRYSCFTPFIEQSQVIERLEFTEWKTNALANQATTAMMLSRRYYKLSEKRLEYV